MEQWRWIEISNHIRAYSVIGKVKVDTAEVFFGSLCVFRLTRRGRGESLFPSFSFFFSFLCSFSFTSFALSLVLMWYTNSGGERRFPSKHKCTR